jgi:hypothetical protein
MGPSLSGVGRSWAQAPGGAERTGATPGPSSRETAPCRWLPRRVASVERHEKLRKDTQQACVPSGCWPSTYNREDFQDISLLERLKSTGNRLTKSAEEPVRGVKSYHIWAKSHTMRTDSAPHGHRVSTCASAASVCRAGRTCHAGTAPRSAGAPARPSGSAGRGWPPGRGVLGPTTGRRPSGPHA